MEENVNASEVTGHMKYKQCMHVAGVRFSIIIPTNLSHLLCIL